jgi:hypothetical protein
MRNRLFIRLVESGKMSWVRHVTHMRERRNGYKSVIGNAEGETPFERT